MYESLYLKCHNSQFTLFLTIPIESICRMIKAYAIKIALIKLNEALYGYCKRSLRTGKLTDCSINICFIRNELKTNVNNTFQVFFRCFFFYVLLRIFFLIT